MQVVAWERMVMPVETRRSLMFRGRDVRMAYVMVRTIPQMPVMSVTVSNLLSQDEYKPKTLPLFRAEYAHICQFTLRHV